MCIIDNLNECDDIRGIREFMISYQKISWVMGVIIFIKETIGNSLVIRIITKPLEHLRLKCNDLYAVPYTVQCTLSSAHCALHSTGVQCTLKTVKCTV